MSRSSRRAARLFPLLMLLLAPALLAAQNRQDAIELAVDAREAPRGILRARLTIPVRSGPLTLFYPKWIPGEHGPTGPISDLVDLKLRSAGAEVPWQRDPLEMYTFHCTVPPGATSLEVSLDFLYDTDTSGFTSGSSATAFLAVINWNQLLLYPQGRSAAGWTYTARLQLPQGWKYGTALPVAGEDAGGIQFKPVTLETLVDSPLIAGRYFRKVSLGEVDGISHEMDIVADDQESLEMPPDAEAGMRDLIQEGGALFGARHYTQYHFLLTLSDHVAHFGLEHHESSDDRLGGDTLTSRRANRSLGGILPHEYVHSWNGKYRRPAGLATPDFNQPMDTDMLWVYEGLTEYLGWILPARSGLWTPEELRSTLARSAAALDHRAGRTWRSLADTATSAQFLYGSRGAWSDLRRGTDFYEEAALVWLEADIMLRQKSNGRYSLDDFCKRFYGSASGSPKVVPYGFQDIVAALTELVPYDWKGFLLERLNSTAPHAPLGGIEGSGWKLAYREPQSGEGQDDPPGRIDVRYSLGLVLREEGAVADVMEGGPAARAGLTPDVKLIAVNGHKYSPAVLRQAIDDAKSSTEPMELLVENRDLYRTYRVDYHDGERSPYLERDPSKPDLLNQIIQPRAK
jgi:predicted metalloprotease with PDZ domain